MFVEREPRLRGEAIARSSWPVTIPTHGAAAVDEGATLVINGEFEHSCQPAKTAGLVPAPCTKCSRHRHACCIEDPPASTGWSWSSCNRVG